MHQHSVAFIEQNTVPYLRFIKQNRFEQQKTKNQYNQDHIKIENWNQSMKELNPNQSMEAFIATCSGSARDQVLNQKKSPSGRVRQTIQRASDFGLGSHPRLLLLLWGRGYWTFYGGEWTGGCVTVAARRPTMTRLFSTQCDRVCSGSQ